MKKNKKGEEDVRSYIDWIKKYYKWSWIIFILSLSLLIIAVVIIIVAVVESLFSFEICDLSSCLLWLDAGAVKSLATSVSLAGLVMAWFLQAVKDRECGQAMIDIIRHIFPRYHWNILVFFISSAISIFFSGTNNLSGDVAFIPKETDIIISAFTLLSALLAIVNIAWLCAKILFSFNKRRDAAFSRLYALIKKDDEGMKHGAFEKWITEIRACIDNNESAHAEGFFCALCQIQHDFKSYDSKEKFIKTCSKYLSRVAQKISASSDSYYGKQVCECIGNFKADDLTDAKEARKYFLILYIIELGNCFIDSGITAPSPNEFFSSVQSIWDFLWGDQTPEAITKSSDKTDEKKAYYAKCFLYYFTFLSIAMVDCFGSRLIVRIKDRLDEKLGFLPESEVTKKLGIFKRQFTVFKEKAQSFKPDIFEKESIDSCLKDMLNVVSCISGKCDKADIVEEYEYTLHDLFGV